MWKQAKAYAWAFAAFLIGILALTTRHLFRENSRLTKKVEEGEARIHRRQVIAEADVEIEEVERDVRERIKKDSADAAFDPNSLWNNEDEY